MFDNYALQQAVFSRIRAGGAGAAAVAPQLPEAHAAALADDDLRALSLHGVHPVLLNAFARLTGRSRDDYRGLLAGTRPSAEGVKPRWRAS
ncbi:hypothetical protein AB0E62_23390 [Streptomyces sp. NPDC038707]|uniref:hypothetical protein n=1 Tax=unclassified Streptomyces TaxID=2593676 RepID=UPI0033DCB1E6